MGGFLTRLYWGGDPDVEDNVTGMSRRDVYNVQRTWAPVYADAGEYGLRLFLGLFLKDPETKTFFKAIRDKTEEEIKNSYQFKAHVHNLMASLNTAVVNLNQPLVAAALMNKLGDSHRTRHIQTKHFEVFSELMMEMFKNELKLSPQTLESWSKFIKFIYKNIFLNLNATS